MSQAAGAWDQALCLGDMAGYGPDPNECIDRVRDSAAVILAGNHDLAAAGIIDLSDFAAHARCALEWTIPRLVPANAAFLSRLSPMVAYQGLLLSHGSPKDPVWDYILNPADVKDAFLAAEFGCCFFAHTHIPAFSCQYQGKAPGFLPKGCQSCELGYGSADLSLETGFVAGPGGIIRRSRGKGAFPYRLLLNPGSVGFPRVEEQAAAMKGRGLAQYALFDTATGIWQFKRAGYYMRDTAERMRKAGLSGSAD